MPGIADKPEASAFGPVTNRSQAIIAIGAVLGIILHLVLRFGVGAGPSVGSVKFHELPLLLVLVLGGLPLVIELALKLFRLEFGADILAAISIVASLFLDEYLAGSLVVLMLAGGAALENFAVRNASSVLNALARRLPAVAHQRIDHTLADVPLSKVAIGDVLLVYPHEACPVDGTVVEGHGVMDESYLTGEPYMISKAPGSQVLSGAVNGETALSIRADKVAVDSRYAKIMQVMRTSEQRRPRLRRLGDKLGA